MRDAIWQHFRASSFPSTMSPWRCNVVFAHYSTARGGFQFPNHPSGQAYLPPAIPLKAQLKHYLQFYDIHPDPPATPCVSTHLGGITGGYKILILSSQVKQGKVYSILITPLQSHSKLHWKIPVFSLQCFLWNGWNHRGVKKFNPST